MKKWQHSQSIKSKSKKKMDFKAKRPPPGLPIPSSKILNIDKEGLFAKCLRRFQHIDHYEKQAEKKKPSYDTEEYRSLVLSSDEKAKIQDYCAPWNEIESKKLSTVSRVVDSLMFQFFIKQRTSLYAVFGGKAWDFYLGQNESLDWDIKIDLRTRSGGQLWAELAELLMTQLPLALQPHCSGKVSIEKKPVFKHNTVRFCLFVNNKDSGVCLVDLHPVFGAVLFETINQINVEIVQQLIYDAERVIQESQIEMQRTFQYEKWWIKQLQESKIKCDSLLSERWHSTLRKLLELPLWRGKLCRQIIKNQRRLSKWRTHRTGRSDTTV
jgi:hypothetical protein